MCMRIKLRYYNYSYVYDIVLFHSDAELQSHRVTTTTTSHDTSSDFTAASSKYDSDKPPDYHEALTYRKPSVPDEGYPEPSLVDDPPPPSYNFVN